VAPSYTADGHVRPHGDQQHVANDDGGRRRALGVGARCVRKGQHGDTHIPDARTDELATGGRAPSAPVPDATRAHGRGGGGERGVHLFKDHPVA